MTVVFATGGLAALQLESLVDPAPAALPPRVRITVSNVASSLTFTLTRLCEGESEVVPGWRARRFTDSDVDVDWAAPLNRPVTYTLSADGVAICTATIILESETAIIQDPIQPEKFLPFTLRANLLGTASLASHSLKELEYRTGTSLIPIMGSSRPVALGGQRQAASGVVYRIRTYTDEDAERFLRVIKEAPTLLIRTLPGMRGVPALTYVDADVQRQQFTTHLPGGKQEYWMVTGDLVAAVLQAAISGFVTNDEVQQLLAGVLNSEVDAAYAGLTNLDVQKDPLIYAKR